MSSRSSVPTGEDLILTNFTPVLTVPKEIIYFCLSFTGIHSSQIRTQISRLCNAADSVTYLDIRFVFRSLRRISSFFPFKDKVPKYLRTSVVYLLKCRCCCVSYVNQTTRHLRTSISEHLGISPITGRHSTNPAMATILVSYNDFQLSSCSDLFELMIHEGLVNKYILPNLNVQNSSVLHVINIFYFKSFLWLYSKHHVGH